MLTAMAAGCSSEGGGSKGDANTDYTVTVKDALGTPYTEGVVVRFMSGEEQVAMQPVDAQGKATASLKAGEYTAKLDFTDTEKSYYYNEGITLNAENPTADVQLSYRVDAEPMVVGVGASEYDAYYVGVGSTYVDLTADTRNYFIFVPTESGNYEFTVADGAAVSFGYYGMPSYIQENPAVEVVDNRFTISVGPNAISTGEGGTATYVLGIDAAADTKSCVIGIQRLGEHIKTLEDYPWDIYKNTATLSAYTLPEGAEIKEFDLTASTDSYKLVYNEADGFYHLDSKDGPLVLARLAEDCEFIDCLKTIADHTGIVKYFFDENGEFDKKEDYTGAVLEYIEVVDEDGGVYPLTEDLKYIIQQFGDYQGWWNPDHLSYRFRDMDGNNLPGYNNEIAWLLMCCYID